MLEGTLLGLVYLLAVCVAILGLYVITFFVIYLIKKYQQLTNTQQNIQHNTINDSLLIRIND